MKSLHALIMILGLSVSVAASEKPSWRLGDAIRFRAPAILVLGTNRFNMALDSDLHRLADFTANIPSGGADTSALVERGPSEVAIQKRDGRGLGLLHELAIARLAEADASLQRATQNDILEVASALANNHRAAIPEYVDLIQLPILLGGALHHPIGKGARAATNSAEAAVTFWKAPADIAAANLGAGFGRAELPDYSKIVWSYAAPKKAGRNGGCELVSIATGQRIKIKFAETHSEPFTARIFDALGYNAIPTDYASELRIRYDRRFFTQFNSRRPMTLRAGIFFVPLWKQNLQASLDPFGFIKAAVLKDGTTLTAAELRERLYTHDGHFNETFEESIDCLITSPANVQCEPAGSHSIGPWDFAALGHADLREVRAAGLLAAWLGWWDARFENTRLRAAKTPAGIEIKHYFTDLGGGLGLSSGTFRHSCEKVDEFPSVFTRRRNGRFQIVNYQPVERNAAFSNMTLEEARWMADLISQLTPSQITSALEAAGFSEKEVHTYTTKLLARREHLLADLRP